MKGAASVTEVQLFATHDAFSEGLFMNAEILLCHTSVTALTTSFQANYAGHEPYTVFSRDTLAIDWTAPGWNGLVFDRPFDYDGADNLIIEFRYLGEDGRTINARAFYPPTPYRTLDAGLPTSADGELLSFMNSMRIYYTPATGVEDPSLPGGFGMRILENPCESPRLAVELPGPSAVCLELYSLDGRMASSLDAGFLDAGTHCIEPPVAGLAPGLYLARAEACGGIAVQCVLLVR
jgi:hypothetical protein